MLLTIRSVAIVGLLGSLAASAMVAQEPSVPSQSNAEQLLRSLDHHLQARFLDTTRGFGMGRMEPGGRSEVKRHSFGRLVPENPGEEAAVQALRSAGLEAALYLASYENSEELKAPFRWGVPLQLEAPLKPFVYEHNLQTHGPLNITRISATHPSLAAISDLARAFAHAELTASATSLADGWDVIARPVRLSDQCLSCHRANAFLAAGRDTPMAKYRSGDVLAVLLYAYRTVH